MFSETIVVEDVKVAQGALAGKKVDVHREKGIFFEINGDEDMRVDLNGDGVITRDEWRQHTEQMDSDAALALAMQIEEDSKGGMASGAASARIARQIR